MAESVIDAVGKLFLLKFWVASWGSFRMRVIQELREDTSGLIVPYRQT